MYQRDIEKAQEMLVAAQGFLALREPDDVIKHLEGAKAALFVALRHLEQASRLARLLPAPTTSEATEDDETIEDLLDQVATMVTRPDHLAALRGIAALLREAEAHLEQGNAALAHASAAAGLRRIRQLRRFVFRSRLAGDTSSPLARFLATSEQRFVHIRSEAA